MNNWVTTFFEEVTEKITDRDHFTPTYYEEGIPIISPKDFYGNDKISFENCKYISLEAHQRNRKKTDLEVDDIVFTRIGARLGKACIVESWMPEFSILHSAAMIRVNHSKILPLYFLQYLKSNLLQRQIDREVQSIGVPDLGLDKIKAFKIKYPPLPQQRKISKILSTIDHLIEKTEAAITKYQAIKQGMMQDLFTRGIGAEGQLRPAYADAPELYKETVLGWVPREWEVVTWGDACEKVIVGIATSTTKFFTKKGVPLIRNQNIKENELNIDDLLYITEGFSKINKTKRLEEGDILSIRTGYPGLSCLVPKSMAGSQTFTTLISRAKKEFNPQLLVYFINSEFGRKQIFNLQAGGAQQNLNVSWLSLLKIFKISIKEQEAMVIKINHLYTQRETEESYLQKLQTLKKGLMQDLLTGKVAVKVAEEMMEQLS